MPLVSYYLNKEEENKTGNPSFHCQLLFLSFQLLLLQSHFQKNPQQNKKKNKGVKFDSQPCAYLIFKTNKTKGAFRLFAIGLSLKKNINNKSNARLMLFFIHTAETPVFLLVRCIGVNMHVLVLCADLNFSLEL